MAEGDSFLGFLKDAVNSVPILGAYSNAAWGQGNYDPNAAPTKDFMSADATAGERFASVVNTIPGLHVAGEATTAAADSFAPLKFVLDFGNRTTDSFFTGAAVVDDSNPETSFADGWVQGWESWGTADHVTAGQLVGATINNGMAPTGLSPFTSQGIKEIQTLSGSTWYGDLAGATTDVAAGFLGVPTGKLATLGRDAHTLTTLAAVEDTAHAFNAGTRAPLLPAPARHGPGGHRRSHEQPSGPAVRRRRVRTPFRCGRCEPGLTEAGAAPSPPRVSFAARMRNISYRCAAAGERLRPRRRISPTVRTISGSTIGMLTRSG